MPVTGCCGSFCLCLNEKCVIIVTITMKRKLEVKNLDQPLYQKRKAASDRRCYDENTET